MGTHSLKLHFCWFLDHPSSRQPDPGLLQATVQFKMLRYRIWRRDS